VSIIQYVTGGLLIDYLYILFFFRHGLGDTYNKLFCDPKLPYADAAKKWKESKNKITIEVKGLSNPADEFEDSEQEEKHAAAKKNKPNSSDKKDDGDDVQSPDTIVEAESSTKEDNSNWFNDHTLELRLQRIIHAVQSGENEKLPCRANSTNTSSPAPSASSAPSPRTPQSYLTSSSLSHLHGKHKRPHIAIDVETERAKLHALLNTQTLLSECTFY
jgi:hypothetical protein